MENPFLFCKFARANHYLSMTPSFFALLSKAGIACAADMYKSFYCLHKKLPVAIAVNPESPIPWETIIKKYRKQLGSTPLASLADYVEGFHVFLSTLEPEDSWKGVSQEESHIMFLGFGKEDVFPSVYDTYVQTDRDGTLGLSDGEIQQVTLNEPVLIHMLGNFEYVSPLLFGCNKKIRDFYCDRYPSVWEDYVERVSELIKGEPYERNAIDKLRKLDCDKEISREVDATIENNKTDMLIGIATFSVEDMVSAVEAIVDANARFGHLLSDAPGNPGGIKEIAVITIPEGVSWIINKDNKRRNLA